jgi:hypothetical protein
MHEFSRQSHNAFIEQMAEKEYGWNDWLDEFPDYLHPRAYYGRRSRKKDNPTAQQPPRIDDLKKGRV